MKAVVSLRVSSKEQAEGGYSIAWQRETCLRYLKDNGWVLAGEFEFPMSGRTVARTAEFARMIRLIEQDPSIKRLVMVQVDRLMRDTEDFADLRRAMRKLGVQLAFVTEQFDESPGGEFSLNVRIAQARYESRIIGERVKRGQIQKAKEGGWPSNAPLGYKIVRKDGNRKNEALLVFDPIMAPLVRETFQLYATGDYSLASLLAEMTRRGLRTSKGTPVQKSNLATRILQNRAYLGVVIWNGVEYPGKHEPLVSADLFERVQQILQTHKSGGTRLRKHFHYLRGAAFCGGCGSRLSSSLARGHGGEYSYFYCLGRQTKRTDCTEPYMRYEVLEARIEEAFGSLRLTEEGKQRVRQVLDQEIEQRLGETLRSSEQTERKIAKRTKQLDRLLRAYLDETIDQQTFKRNQDAIQSELDELRGKLALSQAQAEQAREVVAEALRVLDTFPAKYREAIEGTTRRRYNSALVDAVMVRDRQVAEIHFKPLFAELSSLAKVQIPSSNLHSAS